MIFYERKMKQKKKACAQSVLYFPASEITIVLYATTLFFEKGETVISKKYKSLP